MANIRQVFDAVVDNGTNGKVVKIQGVASANEFETIRTRLCTLWSQHREVLLAIGGEDSDPLLKLSLCGTFDKDASVAAFFLGKPRRRAAKSYSFEIVDSGAMPEPAGPIPEAVNDELPAPTTKVAN